MAASRKLKYGSQTAEDSAVKSDEDDGQRKRMVRATNQMVNLQVVSREVRQRVCSSRARWRVRGLVVCTNGYVPRCDADNAGDETFAWSASGLFGQRC